MSIFDLLFPKRCLGCRKSGKYLCKACLNRVEKANPVCPVCKNFSLKGITHASCRHKTSLDGAVAIWRHQGVIKYAISRLKYNFNFDIASELADLASSEIDLKNFAITPIPIHKDRQKWRGFNQSDILSKRMAKNLSLVYKEDLLIRIKTTIPQVKLNKNQRLRSIRGVFAVNNSPVPEKVFVFDDVWTTGATLNEAAKVLKKAGAKEVWGMALAR